MVANELRERRQQLITSIIDAAREGNESKLSYSLDTLYLLGTEEGYQRRISEETAGAPPVTYDDFRSMLAVGFHTAFRKATDHPYASAIHLLIDQMRDGEWGAVIDFTAEPLWAVMRDGGLIASDVPNEYQPRLRDLTAHILAHLNASDGNERREMAVKRLISQVVRLGMRSVSGQPSALETGNE